MDFNALYKHVKNISKPHRLSLFTHKYMWNVHETKLTILVHSIHAESVSCKDEFEF